MLPIQHCSPFSMFHLFHIPKLQRNSGYRLSSSYPRATHEWITINFFRLCTANTTSDLIVGLPCQHTSPSSRMCSLSFQRFPASHLCLTFKDGSSWSFSNTAYLFVSKTLKSPKLIAVPAKRWMEPSQPARWSLFY